MADRNMEGAGGINAEHLGALPLGKEVDIVVGTTATLLSRPGSQQTLVLQVESGTFRFRPGDYVETTFLDADVDVTDDVAVIDSHSYSTGDGPYKLSVAGAAMTALTSIVITDGPPLLTRTVGDWLEEGFVAGQTITIAGSASNEGTEVIDTVTALVITTVGALTPEGAQTDLVVTSPGVLPTGLAASTLYYLGVDPDGVDPDEVAFYLTRLDALADGTRENITAVTAGGIHSIAESSGWAEAATPTVAVTDGYASMVLAAGATLILSAPERLTVVGFTATDVLTHWWV